LAVAVSIVSASGAAESALMRIFVSYSHKDRDLVFRLASDLSKYHTVTVDVVSFVPNVSLIEQINACLENANYVVPVISRFSVRSVWVKREVAIAYQRSLAQDVTIVPVVLGMVEIPAFIGALPYVRIEKVASYTSYMNGLYQLLRFIGVGPIVSRNLVISRFGNWGGLSVIPAGEFGVQIDSGGLSAGATGLVYNGPIYVTGFKKLTLEIANTSQSDFSGWSPGAPKMLKLEFDNEPIYPVDRSISAKDDLTYISPVEGPVVYNIPPSTQRRGVLNKMDLVFGRGAINKLELSAAFS
jgi:hypothetical protein